MSVCYDMRFPELYRELVSQGAEWLAMPAAFTVPTGRAHWETLLRARAIENLCYVVAPAQAGLHTSGRETYGDSLIVDYWGKVLSRLAKGSGVITADVDLASQADRARGFQLWTIVSWEWRVPPRFWYERAQRRIDSAKLRGGRENDPRAIRPR